MKGIGTNRYYGIRQKMVGDFIVILKIRILNKGELVYRFNSGNAG